MKRINVLLGPLVLALTAISLTGCGSSQDTAQIAKGCKPVVNGVHTTNSGKLTMAVAEYPPYISNANGLSGVDGELLLHVAKALCLQPGVQTQSFTAIIESVKNGRADLTAGNWYINADREATFEVSQPVYADKMAIITKSGGDTIAGLQGKAVGTTQGYLWVADLQKALGKSNVHLYSTEDAAYQDVKVGRIAAGVITYGGGSHLLASNNDNTTKLQALKPDPRVQASVGSPQSAVLTHKGDTALLKAVNVVISKMKADGSLAQILKKNGLPASAVAK